VDQLSGRANASSGTTAGAGMVGSGVAIGWVIADRAAAASSRVLA
jgi:hypothetical protein